MHDIPKTVLQKTLGSSSISMEKAAVVVVGGALYHCTTTCAIVTSATTHYQSGTLHSCARRWKRAVIAQDDDAVIHNPCNYPRPSGQASASKTGDTGFDPFFPCRSNHISDLLTGVLLATLPGAWSYQVGARTSCPYVCVTVLFL